MDDDGIVVPLAEDVDGEMWHQAELAANLCPLQAILLRYPHTLSKFGPASGIAIVGGSIALAQWQTRSYARPASKAR